MRIHPYQAASRNRDAYAAVAEIRDRLGREPLDALLFFCSPDYDLEALGAGIVRAFDCPVAGCTSSGHIGPDGFSVGGLVALGFRGGGLRMTPYLIHPLMECTRRTVDIAARAGRASGRRFGLLLVDGLSKAEERLTSALYQSLDAVPFIGGSAGDDLAMRRTHVYHDGRFLSDAAVFCMIETEARFAVFKLQHFVRGSQRLVITDADVEQRVIREIDGVPAATAYAEAIGLAPERLDVTAFSAHPLMLHLGDDDFIRSIASVGAQGELNCFCAIDTGMIVSIGQRIDPMDTLRRAFADLHRQIETPSVVLGSDCILRRLEFEQCGLIGEVGHLLASERVFGFSTYGEQLNAQHVNQTFIGIAIGA